jgi:hypothetical protein
LVLASLEGGYGLLLRLLLGGNRLLLVRGEGT